MSKKELDWQCSMKLHSFRNISKTKYHFPHYGDSFVKQKCTHCKATRSVINGVKPMDFVIGNIKVSPKWITPRVDPRFSWDETSSSMYEHLKYLSQMDIEHRIKYYLKTLRL